MACPPPSIDAVDCCALFLLKHALLDDVTAPHLKAL